MGPIPRRGSLGRSRGAHRKVGPFLLSAICKAFAKPYRRWFLRALACPVGNVYLLRSSVVVMAH